MLCAAALAVPIWPCCRALSSGDGGIATLSTRAGFLRDLGGAASVAALASPATLLTVASQPASAAPAVYASVQTLPSVDAAIEVLSEQGNRKFLRSVVASGYRFLYRGLDGPGVKAAGSSAPSPVILSGVNCDLLDPATYGSAEAAGYFASLDRRLAGRSGAGPGRGPSPVRPGNGHLGTTSVGEAASWGPVASIWPLGEDAHFAWFADGGAFYPRRPGAGDDVVVEGRDCGRLSLEDILGENCNEVLFRADQGFLAIPLGLERELRKKLKSSYLI